MWQDDEEDGRNGNVVASVVKVKPRPKMSAAAQPPRNLLLRAMADAHRSVAKAPVRETPPEINKAEVGEGENSCYFIVPLLL